MLGSSAYVKVRKGKLSDARTLAEVFRLSWEHTYQGIIPHLHLETLIRKRSRQWWAAAIRSGESVLVLELEGKIVGYATWGAARARSKYEGEIYELYLAPVYQGLGLGEHLFEACRHALDARKLNGLIIWALLDNTPAIDFYWRRGGRPVAQAFDRIGRRKLEKVAFGWS